MARATIKRFCPFFQGQCKEADCALFLGEKSKGDCSIHVLAVRHKIQLDDVKENNHLKRLETNLRKMGVESNREEVKDIARVVFGPDEIESYLNR